MKKVLTITACFLLFSAAVSGQAVRFGLTASPVFSWTKLDYSAFERDGIKFGVKYGLLLDVNIGDMERYAFATGITLTHNGGKFIARDTFLDVRTNMNMRLQYLDIPLTMKLKTNEANYMRYFGQIGIIPSFNIRARGDWTVETPTDSHTFENEKIEAVNLFNLALSIGGGVEYIISDQTSLVGGIFFNNGFVNVVDDDDDDKITLLNLGINISVLF